MAIFKHRMDPLVRTELDRLFGVNDDLLRWIEKLQKSHDAIEEKLDQLLSEIEKPTARSIEGEEKPEPLAMSPGHKPWSQRKRARAQATASPAFVERVVKSAAVTKADAATEDTKT